MYDKPTAPGEKKGEIFDGCNLYFSDSACILHCELNNNVIS